MANLLEITTLYHELSFVDRIIFYTTLSNDVTVCDEEVQSFLIETRMQRETTCVHCGQDHIVKNGKRKDGVQRYLCRDQRKPPKQGRTLYTVVCEAFECFHYTLWGRYLKPGASAGLKRFRKEGRRWYHDTCGRTSHQTDRSSHALPGDR